MEIRKKKNKIPAVIALFCSLLRFALFALPHSQYDRLSSRTPLKEAQNGELVNWSITIPGILSIFAILRNSVVLVVSLSSLFLSQPYSHRRWNIFLLIFFVREVGCEIGVVASSFNLVIDSVSFIRWGNYLALSVNLALFIAFIAFFYPCVIKPSQELDRWRQSIPVEKQDDKTNDKDENKYDRIARIDLFVEQGKRSKEEGEKRKDAIHKK